MIAGFAGAEGLMTAEELLRLVWVIDSDRKVADAYRSDGSVASIASDGVLDGERVVFGFSCGLSELFE